MNDTIAAISTAVTEAGIGIVRISGPLSTEILCRIFRPKKEKDLRSLPSHTIHYGYIMDQDVMIDEVLVMYMKGPHTYTGEDTVEIDCHGGIYSVRRVLETVLSNGARIAEPGEFTKRAFLSGRLDLSQAEAVMDVIRAKNEYALESSLQQLKGSLREAVTGIRSRLLYQIAYIETALDDPEHYDLSGYPEELLAVIDEEEKKLQELLSHSSDGRILQEGIRTVILGKPNAGKSSILNLILGEDRAIVTDIAGTTRDVLEEYVNLGGMTLHMVDTAGIRDTDDKVERIGVERAREMAGKADLILYVVDSSTPLDENDLEIMELLHDRNAIVLYNKTDLSSAVTLEEIKTRTDKRILSVSAKEKTGMDELIETIREMFFAGTLSFNDQVYITNLRHKEALQEALESLHMVRDSIRMQMPEDFFSIDLRNACDSLGRISGETVGEDLVNEIFSRFCVGK